MKINAEKFSQFLNLVNLSGDVEIKECIFRGTSDKLSVVAVTPTKVVIVGAELLGDFSSLGDMGIDNLALLKKVVSACKGEIDISKTTNKFKIASGKKLKAELALRSLQYVQNEVEKSKFDVLHTKASGNQFTIDSDTIKEFSSYYSVFGKELLVSGEGNSVTFEMTNAENSMDLTIDVPESVVKFDVKLGGLIMKILGVVPTDKAYISINDKATVILINVKSDDYEIKYLVAPMVK